MSDQNKKRKTAKKIGLSWITVWLIVVAIVFSGIVGYATYTGVNIVKRVVSTKTGSGLLFSSNYMTTNTLTSIEYGNYSDYYDEESGQPLSINPEFTMTVCNFSQGDKSTWYSSSNIRYRVKAELFLSERYTAEEAQEAGKPDLEGTFKPPTAADLEGKVFGIKYKTDDSFSYFSAGNLTINYAENKTLTKTITINRIYNVKIIVLNK